MIEESIMRAQTLHEAERSVGTLAVSAPSGQAPDRRPIVAIGVTTWNRERYIRRFVSTFDSTRSGRFRWVLIIADDGSTDGTIEYLDQLRLEDCQIVIIKNKNATVTGQTNAIFLASSAMGFDFGFKCDDDVYFTRPGWDELYFDTARETGLDHLVYHNERWKPAKHLESRGKLESRVSAVEALGCFWTYTPEMLETVGYFDETNFAFRGHAHLDFTIRSCRAGYNNVDFLWDAAGSENYVSMWQRDEYIDTVDWGSDEVKRILSPAERQRRMDLIAQPGRQRVDLPILATNNHRAAVDLWPRHQDAVWQLAKVPRFRVTEEFPQLVDAVYVLNLDDDQAKWGLVSAALARHGLLARRFPATDGNAPANVAAWRDYQARGLELKQERQIRRRLIASPGAWGYLLTMERLLKEAKKRRYRRIMVFDDDVILHREFADLLRMAERELPPDWRVVYLGCTQKVWEHSVPYSAHLYRPRAAVDGSYAYMIDASVFDEILDSIARMDSPYDSGPLTEAAERIPERTFVLKPNAAIADVRYSDLRAPRDQHDFAERARWTMADYDDLPVRTSAGGHLRRERDASQLLSVAIVMDGNVRGLLETILALRHQTDSDFEVVLFGNGTSDNSVEMVGGALEGDSRFRIVTVGSRVDWGTAARLTVDETVGGFISFLPPGSVPLPGYIADLRGLVKSGEADAVRASVASYQAQPIGSGMGVEFVSSVLTRSDTRVRAQLLGGALSRALIEEVGQIFGPTEPAFQEALERARIGRSLREAGPPIVVDSEEALHVVMDSRGLVADATQLAGWDLLHDEVRNRVRPSRVRASDALQPLTVWPHYALGGSSARS